MKQNNDNDKKAEEKRDRWDTNAKCRGRGGGKHADIRYLQ
jgi:hypothetical protein